jgi:hypothetical protein
VQIAFARSRPTADTFNSAPRADCGYAEIEQAKYPLIIFHEAILLVQQGIDYDPKCINHAHGRRHQRRRRLSDLERLVRPFDGVGRNRFERFQAIPKSRKPRPNSLAGSPPRRVYPLTYAANQIRSDGVVSLQILGRQVDTSPRA